MIIKDMPPKVRSSNRVPMVSLNGAFSSLLPSPAPAGGAGGRGGGVSGRAVAAISGEAGVEDEGGSTLIPIPGEATGGGGATGAEALAAVPEGPGKPVSISLRSALATSGGGSTGM